MPLYMDLHILPGAKALEVADAHRQDILIQHEHDCNCITYWLDEKRGNVFCLIEAPEIEAVEAMHRKSHGLVPNRIIEVDDMLVESFLGRIIDPVDVNIADNGLKVFTDSAFRILLVTRMIDPVLLRYKTGKEKAAEIVKLHHESTRRQLSIFGGNEVENEGPGFIASFISASKAVACAIAIQKNIDEEGLQVLDHRVAIHAGEPISSGAKLFGETLDAAGYMCSMANKKVVVISDIISELISKDCLVKQSEIMALSGQEQLLLVALYTNLARHWQDPGFNVAEYGKSMAMSKSQLYRLCLNLTGLAPNALLKTYRLEKARELMKKRSFNISEITFDCGFTSPSYFTKCFKKKFGLLPMAYLDLLH